MKILIKIVVAFLLLLVVGLVALYFSINGIAKYAIDNAGTSALGVTTHVDAVSIGIFSGVTTMDGLSVANPPGYNKDDFLSLKSGELDASLGGLMGSSVNVDRLVLSGIKLDIEQNKDGFNYQVILDNAKGDEAKDDATEKQADEDGTKDAAEPQVFHFGEILLEDVMVTANLLSGLGKDTGVSIPIKKLQLKDVGSGKGLPLDKVTVVVVEALLHAVAQAGVVDLPGSLIEGLASALGSASGVSLKGFSIDTGSGLKNVGDSVGKLIDGVTEGIPKGVGDLLNNALGGNKDQSKDTSKK